MTWRWWAAAGLLSVIVAAALWWLTAAAVRPVTGAPVTITWDRPADTVAYHLITAQSGTNVVSERLPMPETRATLTLVPGTWTIAVSACTLQGACSEPTVTRHQVGR